MKSERNSSHHLIPIQEEAKGGVVKRGKEKKIPSFFSANLILGTYKKRKKGGKGVP
jgi:hypothetical protein